MLSLVATSGGQSTSDWLVFCQRLRCSGFNPEQDTVRYVTISCIQMAVHIFLSFSFFIFFPFYLVFNHSFPQIKNKNLKGKKNNKVTFVLAQKLTSIPYVPNMRFITNTNSKVFNSTPPRFISITVFGFF